MTKWRYIIRISANANANANNRDHDRYGAEMCIGFPEFIRKCVPG